MLLEIVRCQQEGIGIIKLRRRFYIPLPITYKANAPIVLSPWACGCCRGKKNGRHIKLIQELKAVMQTAIFLYCSSASLYMLKVVRVYFLVIIKNICDKGANGFRIKSNAAVIILIMPNKGW